MRLRATALGEARRETESPMRPCARVFVRANMVKNSSRVLRPPFITAANSFGRNNRRDLGSPPGGTHRWSDAQPGAALRAARAQNGTSAGRFHARAEPVGALAFQYAWMIGAFHILCLAWVGRRLKGRQSYCLLSTF